MMEKLEMPAHAFAIGMGATAIMDLWVLLQKRLFGTQPLNYALVGRWLGHLTRGRFRHKAISNAPPVTGERVIGWAAHYATGVAFALLLLATWGMDWTHRPTLGPALAVGIATIVFPFLVLQPAFGLGIAASRTPQPNVARLRSLVTHTSFGVGLYLAAHLLNLFKS